MGIEALLQEWASSQSEVRQAIEGVRSDIGRHSESADRHSKGLLREASAREAFEQFFGEKVRSLETAFGQMESATGEVQNSLNNAVQAAHEATQNEAEMRAAGHQDLHGMIADLKSSMAGLHLTQKATRSEPTSSTRAYSPHSISLREVRSATPTSLLLSGSIKAPLNGTSSTVVLPAAAIVPPVSPITPSATMTVTTAPAAVPANIGGSFSLPLNGGSLKIPVSPQNLAPHSPSLGFGGSVSRSVTPPPTRGASNIVVNGVAVRQGKRN